MKERSLKNILIFPVRMAWRVFSRTATAVLLPFSGLVWVGRLLWHWREIRHADVVVLMTSPTSFGHTVMGPDAVRRMHPGKRCVFLIASWRHEYNPVVKDLWSDIRVIFMPRFMITIARNHRVIALPFLKIHDRMAKWLTGKVIRSLAGSNVVYCGLLELYRDMIVKEGVDKIFPVGARAWGGSFEQTAALTTLQASIFAPPIRLPELKRKDIQERLAQAWRRSGRKGPAKYCCLYLRHEKRDAPFARTRNGSDVKRHLPAISLLNENGYQVLLTGDHEIDPDSRSDAEGGLVDGKNIGVNSNIFQLYAATEADILMGNNGAGICPGFGPGKAKLLLDWYPFYSGMSNSWVYFKDAVDWEGKAIPGQRIFTELLHKNPNEYGDLRNMSGEEILAAVADFIDDVANPGRPDPHADIARLLPADSIFHYVGARLSPAWVKQNAMQSNPIRF